MTPCRLPDARAATRSSGSATALPDFRARLDDRIAQYDYQDAARTCPTGIDQEMLPAEPTAQEQVGDAQVDQSTARSTTRRPDARSKTRAASSSGARRVRRIPFMQQIDEMDCGAACLAMVTRALRPRGVSLARIRQLVNTGLDGTSLRSICQRRRRAGPRDAVGQGLAAAISITCRCRRSCHWDGDHWIVLYRRDARATCTSPIRRSGCRRLHARGVRAEVDRLRGALRLHAGVRAGARRDARRSRGCGRSSGRTRRCSARRSASPSSSACCRWCCRSSRRSIVDRVLVEQDLSLLHLLIVAMGVTMVFIVASLLAAALSAQLRRRCASMPRRSTSSRGACWRCRCRTSPRGAPAICSAASRASGRSATSWCSTASPASRRSRSWRPPSR